ncbi:hypothetical protein FX983_06535 [Pseudomonas frederiksbergensis]|uniref:Uncharacterized protein n=1 Tax=Pseudomonas frederiksbergensis TaxID=104087 RepID=A0A6L5BUQ1_9PSED|nr:hypothetical protein FX983_06535 [Pseudomonas frederiksbergensis]
MVDHDHPTAIEQGAPHVHGAGVERRVRSESDAVLLIEIGVTVVDHQPIDRPVRHQHALGLAGGTGGVHDVGDGFGGLRQCRVVSGLAVQIQPVQIDTARTFRHFLIAERQQHRGLAVFQHEALAFQGRIAIQRHIGRRAFERRQLTGQQVEGARQQDRHAVVRLHVQADQVMRQLVGPLIQCGVAQGFLTVHRRDRVRCTCHLRFEQRQDGFVLGIGAGGGVEIHQQLAAFGVRQDLQVAQRCLRRLFQRLGQLLQRGVHVGADACGADAFLHQGAQQETRAQVIHRQGQRIVGAFFGTKVFHTLPCARGFSRDFAGRAVAVIEQGAEQRRR